MPSGHGKGTGHNSEQNLADRISFHGAQRLMAFPPTYVELGIAPGSLLEGVLAGRLVVGYSLGI